MPYSNSSREFVLERTEPITRHFFAEGKAGAKIFRRYSDDERMERRRLVDEMEPWFTDAMWRITYARKKKAVNWRPRLCVKRSPFHDNQRERHKRTYRNCVEQNLKKKIKHALRTFGVRDVEVWSYLGYSCETLVEHLKTTIPDGKSWDDFISGDIEIDHIIPKSKFKDQRHAWRLSNLRLLTGADNNDAYAAYR